MTVNSWIPRTWWRVHGLEEGKKVRHVWMTYEETRSKSLFCSSIPRTEILCVVLFRLLLLWYTVLNSMSRLSGGVFGSLPLGMRHPSRSPPRDSYSSLSGLFLWPSPRNPPSLWYPFTHLPPLRTAQSRGRLPNRCKVEPNPCSIILTVYVLSTNFLELSWGNFLWGPKRWTVKISHTPNKS